MRSEPTVLFVVGIRSQYIKLAALQRAILDDLPWTPLYVDTGQHYDASLAAQYHLEYDLQLDRSLNCGAPSLGSVDVFARMITSLDSLLDECKPAAVVVFGDANTTLAAGLAAGRRWIPVAHVEAGVRTGAQTVEEFNRVTVDRVARLHLASSRMDLQHLEAENLGGTSSYVGDLVRDLCHDRAGGGTPDPHRALVTLHRTEQTEDLEVIGWALGVLARRGMDIDFVAHPRVLELLRQEPAEQLPGSVSVHESLPHTTLLQLIQDASIVVTDSGALQREAFYIGRRAVIIQERPFWRSLVDQGFHLAVPPFGDLDAAIDEASVPRSFDIDDFGVYPVAPRIVSKLTHWLAD